MTELDIYGTLRQGHKNYTPDQMTNKDKSPFPTYFLKNPRMKIPTEVSPVFNFIKL